MEEEDVLKLLIDDNVNEFEFDDNLEKELLGEDFNADEDLHSGTENCTQSPIKDEKEKKDETGGNKKSEFSDLYEPTSNKDNKSNLKRKRDDNFGNVNNKNNYNNNKWNRKNNRVPQFERNQFLRNSINFNHHPNTPSMLFNQNSFQIRPFPPPVNNEFIGNNIDFNYNNEKMRPPLLNNFLPLPNNNFSQPDFSCPLIKQANHVKTPLLSIFQSNPIFNQGSCQSQQNSYLNQVEPQLPNYPQHSLPTFPMQFNTMEPSAQPNNTAVMDHSNYEQLDLNSAQEIFIQNHTFLPPNYTLRLPVEQTPRNTNLISNSNISDFVQNNHLKLNSPSLFPIQRINNRNNNHQNAINQPSQNYGDNRSIIVLKPTNSISETQIPTFQNQEIPKYPDAKNLNLMPNNRHLNLTSDNRRMNLMSDNRSMNLTSENRSMNLMSNIRHMNLTPDNRNMNLMSDNRLMNQTSDHRRVSLLSDNRHMNLTPDNRHMNLTSNNRPMNLTSDNKHMNLTSDNRHMNLTSNRHMNLASNNRQMNQTPNNRCMNQTPNNRNLNLMPNIKNQFSISNNRNMNPILSNRNSNLIPSIKNMNVIPNRNFNATPKIKSLNQASKISMINSIDVKLNPPNLKLPILHSGDIQKRIRPRQNTKAKSVSPPSLDTSTNDIDKIKEEFGIDEDYMQRIQLQQQLRDELAKRKAEKRKIFSAVLNNTPLPRSNPSTTVKVSQPSLLLSPSMSIKQKSPATPFKKIFPTAAPQQTVSNNVLIVKQDISEKQLSASNKVKIQGLNQNTRESVIRKLCRPYGMVMSIELTSDSSGNRFALVEFEQQAQATKFMETCQRQEIECCQIYITYVNWFVFLLILLLTFFYLLFYIRFFLTFPHINQAISVSQHLILFFRLRHDFLCLRRKHFSSAKYFFHLKKLINVENRLF